MASKASGILSRMRGAFKTVFNRKETPRDLQERDDLYMSILATTHRSLRMRNRLASEGRESREDVEKLIEEAVDKLEAMDAPTTPIVGLRYDLQNTLAPEIVRIFEAFRDVDRQIPAAANATEDLKTDSGNDPMFRSILLDEFDKLSADLDSSPPPGNGVASNIPSPLPYWRLKRGALQTVLSSKDWLDRDDESTLSSGNDGDDSQESIEGSVMSSTPDDFGYYSEDADAEINAAIRHYQMINLTKAALLRERLGYSVLSLKSTLPGAGRGAFIDGSAMAGSLLAFFPGQIWPKEYLTNAAFSTALFKDDGNFQLSIRYDDVLIDSRKAPYTVLNDDNSNPWAVGHITNHPPQNVKPNCRTVMVNFTEKMRLDKSGLERYIPNTYARDPMLLGPKALDRDVLVMHGFGLLASRDLSNEELFYDYRLSPGQAYPEWYNACNEEELKRRWWQDGNAQ